MFKLNEKNSTFFKRIELFFKLRVKFSLKKSFFYFIFYLNSFIIKKFSVALKLSLIEFTLELSSQMNKKTEKSIFEDRSHTQ